MKRLLALALLLFTQAPARAESLPGPVCGRPQVLVQVLETLRRAGQTLSIEPGSAGERPSDRPGLVSCAVRVHTLIYDTAQFGTLPRDQVSVFTYTLEMRRNGIFLRPLG